MKMEPMSCLLQISTLNGRNGIIGALECLLKNMKAGHHKTFDESGKHWSKASYSTGDNVYFEMNKK